ncbi:SRPBCC family protein, partial [Nocardia abscessus]|uniref:SRPBCC family protein n=1 Tax=Nocardia abscessus TaxID=120957 RepID=UPI0024553337
MPSRAVDIDAPADLVWQVITDFPRYGEWNPFVPECRSSLVPGEPIDMLVRV